MGASPIDSNIDSSVENASWVWPATGLASRNRWKCSKCLWTVFSSTSGSTPSSSMVYCVANNRIEVEQVAEGKILNDDVKRWWRPRRFPWKRISAEESLQQIMNDIISRIFVRLMKSILLTSPQPEIMDQWMFLLDDIDRRIRMFDFLD